jgi:hypothetical protein
MTEETELDTKADSDTDPTPTKKVRASEESKSQEGVDTTDSFDAAHSSDSNTNVNGANQPPREKETINASAESTPNRATVANQQSVRTEEVPIAEVDLPGTTIAEKMSSCLQNLRKNEIVAHGQLSNSIARIRSFVEAVIESKGQKGDGKGLNQSPILYICGNPGTGKTMSTTTLCEEAISAQTESNEEWEKAPRLCHISCPSLQNFKYHDGMKRILERMGMKQNQLKRSSNDDLNAATILILDEVDQLLGSKGTESILRQLSSWAKDENNVLSIIGISNAVFNNKTYKLKEYGMVSSKFCSTDSNPRVTLLQTKRLIFFVPLIVTIGWRVQQAGVPNLSKGRPRENVAGQDWVYGGGQEGARIHRRQGRQQLWGRPAIPGPRGKGHHVLPPQVVSRKAHHHPHESGRDDPRRHAGHSRNKRQEEGNHSVPDYL